MKQTHFVPPGHFLNVSWYSPFCLQLCQAPKYQCSNSVKLALLEKKKEMFFALIPVLIFWCIFFFSLPIVFPGSPKLDKFGQIVA